MALTANLREVNPLRLRTLSEEAYIRLIRTARRQHPATVWMANGQVLNVYTREWQQAHVVIAGERIAYVGEKEPLTDEGTIVLDASGYYLVPGYVEPHAHPFQWYTPESLAEHALRSGTTTLISDSLMLSALLPLDDVERLMDELAEHPVKQLFWARLDSQTYQPAGEAFTKEGIARMIRHPRVIQGGELTRWGGVLQEEATLLDGLKRVRDAGKRLEGHLPGASLDTLNAGAAAGITACHESTSWEDVLNRLRLGYYAALRHSSIRPDLPELVAGLRRLGIPWSSRLLLTSDGATPPMLRHGLMNETIRVAIEAGIPPIDAYIMATLNPAVYYGLDAEIGGIAPGRIADILFLADPQSPTPELVVANGAVAAEKGQLTMELPGIAWERCKFPCRGSKLPAINPDWFALPARPGVEVPVLQMNNAVITTLATEQLSGDEHGNIPWREDPGLACMAFIDEEKGTLTRALVRGFGQDIEGLATSFTAESGWLVLGRNPHAMAQALSCAIELGGGIALVDAGQVVYKFALPLGGVMSPLPMAEIVGAAEEFVRMMRAKGHPHLDPIYSLLFFTAAHLPHVRFSGDGLYEVKQARVIRPSESLWN